MVIEILFNNKINFFSFEIIHNFTHTQNNLCTLLKEIYELLFHFFHLDNLSIRYESSNLKLYGLNKINIILLYNKWNGLVVKEFNSILGVQGSNFTNDIVAVNDRILTKYSIPIKSLKLGAYLGRLGGLLNHLN